MSRSQITYDALRVLIAIACIVLITYAICEPSYIGAL